MNDMFSTLTADVCNLKNKKLLALLTEGLRKWQSQIHRSGSEMNELDPLPDWHMADSSRSNTDL